MEQLLLRPESKIRLPNVDEALDLGYAHHVADDKALSEDNVTKRNARLAAARFELLVQTVEVGSAEGGYISCVQGIITSHARGITRRKDQWIKELIAAKEEKDRLHQRIKDSRKSSDGLSIGWKLL